MNDFADKFAGGRPLKVAQCASGRLLKVGKFVKRRPLSQINNSFGGLQLIGGPPPEYILAVCRLNHSLNADKFLKDYWRICFSCGTYIRLGSTYATTMMLLVWLHIY